MKPRQPYALWIALACLAAALGCGLLASPAVTPTAAVTQVASTPSATVEGTDEPVIPATATHTPEPTSLATVQPTAGPPGGSLVVAYVDLNRNLWSWRAGDSPRQLTISGDVENVQVSSDGAWIAFTRTTNFLDYSLWAIQSDGSGEIALMDQPDFADLPRPPEAVSVMPSSFAWAPGTHILGFNTRPTFEGLGLMLNDDLWLANPNTGEREQLLPAGEGGMFYFSPDSSQIAITTPSDISLVAIDGGSRRDGVLEFPRVSTYSEYQFYPTPRWAGDSSYLRVVIPPAAAMEEPEDPAQVWHIPADGSPASLLDSFVTVPLLNPVLSPDLNKVAYHRQVGELADNRRELHIASLEGPEDEAYLTESLLMFAGWSLDSEQFAFMVGDNSRPYLGQLGQPPQPLTDTTGAMDIRWVDSTRFLFITRSGGNVELRLGSVGEPSELIVSAAGEAAPFLNYDFAD